MFTNFDNTTKTEYGMNSGSNVETMNQEFSLQDIQAKLGLFGNETVEVEDASPDLRPSDSTYNMSYARHYDMQQGVQTKASTKTKVLVASYVATVLLLALAITFCAISVNSSFATGVQLSGEASTLAKEINALSAQIAAEDYADLANRAAELGYYDLSQANTQMYSEIETRPAQNFNIQTNWFDSLCDWMSSSFGG